MMTQRKGGNLRHGRRAGRFVRRPFRELEGPRGGTGCEYSREDFVAGFGRTSREVLAEQWPPEILKQHSIEELDRRKEEIFRGLIAANFPAMPGPPISFDLV